jgi:hypothetical protein
MGIEETLRGRPDIPDEDVQEIIARAAKLQDHDSATVKNLASAAEVAAVAEELDIETQYVDLAIAQWRENNEAKPEVEAQTRIKGRGRKMMRWAIASFIVVGILGTAAAVGSVAVFGWSGLAGLGAATAAAASFLLWLID